MRSAFVFFFLIFALAGEKLESATVAIWRGPATLASNLDWIVPTKVVLNRRNWSEKALTLLEAGEPFGCKSQGDCWFSSPPAEFHRFSKYQSQPNHSPSETVASVIPAPSSAVLALGIIAMIPLVSPGRRRN